MTAYAMRLFPQHAQMLAESGVPPEHADARGYISVDLKNKLDRLGVTKSGRNVPGLLVPQLRKDGSVWGYQYRPDTPRLRDGRPVKYETPTGQRNGIDVPPGVGPLLDDPAVALWVTEGVKKADAAAVAGLCCVALPGVWSWRGKNGSGGKTAVPDWHDIALDNRRVVLAFDSDVMVKPAVRRALVELAGYLYSKGARVEYCHLPNADAAKTGLDDYLAAGHTVDDLWAQVRPDLPDIVVPEKITTIVEKKITPIVEKKITTIVEKKITPIVMEDGADLLDEVGEFLARFVAFPSDAARFATTLWAAHAHGLGYFESTPRIGYLAPEKACGKTRALEIVGLLVPSPMHAVNATPAALFRSVASKPTVLYDEIDTVFGPKAKDNEEVRGLLNAGHRRSGVAYRCVGEGTKQEVVAFPAYCAVAFAGIGDLPDTIMSRTIVIPMRRRAPHEKVEPFRARMHEPNGHELRDRLAAWMLASGPRIDGAWPTMPDGVTDRDADVWEPLLAIADAAGGHWPETARAACVALVAAAADSGVESLGIRLLRDLRTVFGDAETMHTETILTALHKLDESPWADLRGKPLDARGLANRLRLYKVGSADVKLDGVNRKGYRREHLWDPWSRYIPVPPGQKSATSATTATAQVTASTSVADGVADENPSIATRYPSATADDLLTCDVAQVAQVADLSESGQSAIPPDVPGTTCGACHQPHDNPNSLYCDTCLTKARAS